MQLTFENLKDLPMKDLPTIESIRQSAFGLLRAQAQVKFLTPGDKWTWYAVAFDGADTCLGFINGNVPQLGYFYLSDLIQGWERALHPVIVDLNYRPEPLKDVLKQYVRLHTYL
jgi:hypothetical protein